MTIPKYVQNILSRSEFDTSVKNSYIPDTGYILWVRKETPYTTAATFRKELDRICAWANRVCPESGHVISCPGKTHHEYQFARIAICNPVMLNIEHLVGGEEQ